jgi:hypothetical protein
VSICRDEEDEADWTHFAAGQFVAGYGPDDAIYDEISED